MYETSEQVFFHVKITRLKQKHEKFFVFLLLFFNVFSHATKLSSLSNSILYTNVLYKNLFISRQLNKKISVIKLCLVRRKQKNPSWNNFTTKTCVKKN